MKTLRAALKNRRTATCGIVGGLAALLPLLGVPMTGPVAAVVAFVASMTPYLGDIFAADAKERAGE